MTKSYLHKVLVLLIVLSLICIVPAWALGPSVILDGEPLTFEVPPIIENNRTLVPLRAIFEALGATVTWDESTQTATALLDNTRILLKIGSPTAIVGNSTVNLDVPAKIVHNRTLVPLRFVSESFGAEVEWNESEQQVIINSGQGGANASSYGFNKVEAVIQSDITDGNYWESLRNLKLTLNPTPNSECSISGSVSTEVQWVWFMLKKGGKQTDIIFKPSAGGQFSRKVYLANGSGTYNLEIYVSNSADKYQTSYYRAGQCQLTNNDTRDLTFLLPSDYVQSDNSTIIALAQQITKGLKTDLEKTKAIHDWVAKNIAYDTDAYFKGSAGLYTAMDTLRLKRAVCNGYANLSAALHRAVGIKAKVVSGVAIYTAFGDTWQKTDKIRANHAWNEIYIDGKWIIEDPTWDAGSVNFTTRQFTFNLKHLYFNPTPTAFALDHYKLVDESY